LINNEQFAGGGQGNARAYLESAVLGDNAIFGTLELRTPNLLKKGTTKREARLHAFVDAGALTLNSPLPEQDDSFQLFNAGIGGRFNLNDRLQGSLDAGYPLKSAGTTSVGDLRLAFRVWTNF
jgi:hemolysin activation/secretion protein